MPDLMPGAHTLAARLIRQPGTTFAGDVVAAAHALQEFDGIGPVGADIFLREVQNVWPWVRPRFDDRALAGAHELGLPEVPEALLDLSGGHPAQLAAALVRVSLDHHLREHVTA